VIGLSVLADVSLSGFSNMSFVPSVGFAVEYSVHIVARWLRADNSMATCLVSTPCHFFWQSCIR
jgi:hypothetical protein